MRVRNLRKPCLVCAKIVENIRSKFCSNTCQMEYQYKQYIAAWQRGEESGNKLSGDLSVCVRRYMREKYNNKCSRCGWAEENPYNGIVHLTIEHKDGNAQNSKEQNLDLICPNCHSLTSTYGTLNLGRGRTSRHKKLGVVAQLGERKNGILEVAGAEPVDSTFHSSGD